MVCTKYWIAACISFFVGILMSVIGILIGNADIAYRFIFANIVLAGIGWVLWLIGLINYIRKR